MSSEPDSAITKHRMHALTEFAASVDSKKIILWLFNQSRGTGELLISYAVGFSNDQIERMRNRYVTLPSTRYLNRENYQLSDDIEISLRIELEAAQIAEQDFHLLPLFNSNPSDTSDALLTGAVFYESNAPAIANIRLKPNLLLLAERIESLRLSRLRNAASSVQSALKKENTSTNDTLQKIGSLLKLELGATNSTFSNQNTDTTFHRELHSEPSSGKNSATEVDFIIYQDSYILEPRKFRPGYELAESFALTKTKELHFLFSGKSRNGYLQNCFSDTDQMVADHVLGYIEPYAAARIFDENYQIIHKKLSTVKMSDGNLAQEIDSLCKQLSIAFRNTFVITADYAEEDVSVSYSSANSSSDIPDSYLSRIKENYLSKWAPDQTQSLLMFAGVDIEGGKCLLEFHLPGDGRRSQLYLLEYEKNTITVSILRSIVIFFNELHNRLKKQEQQSDTISYLTQVRHAVIHHFSAASEGMASLRPLWERSRRSKAYWEGLYNNPILSDQISRSIWSLSQAQILIDNGRFLLGEINRLNRKNYQISSTIESCLRTLNSQRSIRGIVVKSISKGAPPSIMNADEPILRVAIMNIIDNAFKYSQVGSTVVWELEYGAEGYRLSITSSGSPIGDRQFRQYLEVGARGHQRDHLNQRHGTGLGLPVANRILVAHSPHAVLRLGREKRHPDLDGTTNTFFFDMPYLTGQSHRTDLEVNE